MFGERLRAALPSGINRCFGYNQMESGFVAIELCADLALVAHIRVDC